MDTNEQLEVLRAHVLGARSEADHWKRMFFAALMHAPNRTLYVHRQDYHGLLPGGNDARYELVETRDASTDIACFQLVERKPTT